jgi:hypothetical protein
MLCFICGMTMIFVSPDIEVHEKLDLILNQTDSKSVSRLDQKFHKKKPLIKIGTKGSFEIKTRQHLSSHPNLSTEEAVEK